MELLHTPPLPLSRLQRLFIVISAVLIGLTRLLALARTLWDWDEAQFSVALQEYDVVFHQPHPPGFPLFIGAAKLIRLFGGDDFRAVQFVVALGAVALFPLLFWLGREARLPWHVAYLGSVLTVFLPNVWVYGGTAFSDVPGLAVLVAASAMLLRGCRSERAYVWGAFVLALAAAIRPQALIVGAAPAIIATWCRVRVSRKPVIAATAIGIAVLAIAYGSAALASASVHGYFETARHLRDYLREVDSFLSPGRAPLSTLVDDFSWRSIPGPRRTMLAIMCAAGIGVIAAIFRRSNGILILAAMFIPFNLFGWLMLDVHSISRYAVGFAPLYGFLAAEGVSAIASAGRRFAFPLAAIAVGAAVASLVSWTLPALHSVRTTNSPTVAATKWVAANVPRTATVYAHGSMGPYVRMFKPPQRMVWFDKPLPGAMKFNPDDVVLAEGTSAAMRGRTFIRTRDRLFDIVRQRYFEVAVTPALSVITFLNGWYDEESSGLSAWRWMGSRGTVELHPIDGPARLTISGDLPTELAPRHPTMTVTLNGNVIDRFVLTTMSVSKSWVVPANGSGPNILELSLDKVLNPAREGLSPDPRDLGFQLNSYAWEAAAPTP